MLVIPLLRKQLIVAQMTIDDEDLELIAKYLPWRLSSKGYATVSRSIDGKETRLLAHRLIVGATDYPQFQVDHRDGNKLNNCRSNLRLVTSSENMHNAPANRKSRSRARGCHYDPTRRRWRAQVYRERQKLHLGWFRTLDEAKAVVLEWKRTNYPGGERVSITD